MTILQNPVIPIVVRFSMSECSLRVENRRTLESIRPDRLPYVESAYAVLGERLAPVVERQRNRVMNNATARALTAEIASIAAKVTEETDVLFAVTLETDEDRERLDQEARRIVADIGLTVAPPPSEEKDAEIARLCEAWGVAAERTKEALDCLRDEYPRVALASESGEGGADGLP